MVLPCSRHMFVRPVLNLDQHAWTEAAHADAVPARRAESAYSVLMRLESSQ